MIARLGREVEKKFGREFLHAGFDGIQRPGGRFLSLSKERLDKFGSVEFLQIIDSFAYTDVSDWNF